jgi:hypothetical protein
MPLLRINADGAAARCEGGDGALARALAALPEGAPVVVMIHGFRFSRHVPKDDPHRHILALDPDPGCWKAVSWPRSLGFDGSRADEGLCIAFGWESIGTIWRAYREAAGAGRALAEVLTRIDTLRPGTRVAVLAHSLGARVVLQALPHLDRPVLGPVVLMAAAELRGPTDAALASVAGRAAHFVNVTSRENDLFDFLIERLLPRRPDRALGHGLSARPANWIDIQLDHEPTLRALARLGHRIAAPDLRICHWSLYLRPGVFDLYRAILRDGLPLGLLADLLPGVSTPRWSRLLAPPRKMSGLPFGEKAPL